MRIDQQKLKTAMLKQQAFNFHRREKNFPEKNCNLQRNSKKSSEAEENEAKIKLQPVLHSSLAHDSEI